MKNLYPQLLAVRDQSLLKILPFFLFFLSASASLYAQNCTVNAGVDQTVCANGTMTLTGITQGNYPGGGSAATTWTRISGGAVTITSPNSLTTTVTGFSTGTYTFRLSTNCQDGSAIYDDVVITVSPITVSNAGTAQTLCPGNGTLAANNPSPGTGFWSIIGTNNAGLSLITATSATGAISLPASSAGATTLRWTITQGSCMSYSDVVVTNRGGAGPVNAGPDQTLGNCYSSTTSATLAASFAGAAGGQGGTWTTVSGPNTPTITAPSSNTSTVSNLIQGVYVFRWTASGACLNGYDDVQITVPAPTSTLTAANAGAAQTYCDVRTTTVLSGNTPTYAGEVVRWTQTAGPAGATLSSPSSPSTTVNGLDGSSSYTFQYTITNTNSGCSSVNTMTVDYNTAPSITVNGGAKTLMLACGNTMVSVPYTFSGGNTTQCRVVSAPSGYPLPAYWTTITTASPQSFFGITVPGTYVMRFMRTGGTGCAAAYDEVNVIVSKTPTSSRAGTYQTLACNVASTSLAGNIPVSGAGSWSQVSGPNTATIANPALNTSGISGLVNGKYIFKWIIGAGPACPASEDTVSVVVASVIPSAANAGPDRTVCNGSPATLSANVPALNETGAWTVTPAAGISFSNAASPTTTVTGLQANTAYTFTWTISNACGTTSDDVVITANSTTGPVQATAGADQCLPAGTTSTSLAGNAASPAGVSSLWSQISGPASATIASPSGSSSSVTGLANGTYEFVRAMSLSGCASTMDTVLVTVSANVTTANAGADQNLCASTTAILSANTPTVGTGAWSQVAGPGGAVIASPTQNNSTLSGLVPGVYTFRWRISNGGCAGTYDDMVINVSTIPSASDAGPDQSCLPTTSATLAATAPAAGTGLWSQVSGPAPAAITTATAVNTTVTGLANGVYTFRWTVTGGPACAANDDDVVVSVNASASGGGSSSLCGVTTTMLSGNAGSNGTWTLVSGPNTPTLTELSSYTASAENLVPGAYVFRYTLIPAPGCTASYADKTVTLPAPPSAAVAGANQSVCNATSFSLNATAPATGTGTWSKISGPATGNFANGNAAATSFTAAATGLYTFQWTVKNGGCANSAQITVNNAAPASAANAGIDQSLCSITANLAAATPASGTGNWTQVSGPAATILNPALASTAVSGLSSGTYTFRWTVSSGACAATTDDMQISVCAVLPLRLLAFEGEKKNGHASLQWKTANEEGAKSFVVERSDDGRTFSTVAELAARNGASNAYGYNDDLKGFLRTAVYYRLKIVEANGSFSYSNVVRISLQPVLQLVLTVVPNPVRTNASLQIESGKGGKASVRVLDYTGKDVIVQEEVLVEGTTGFVLKDSDRLPDGVYVVTVQTKEGVYSQKLVVRR